jgi:carboxymethylenebutenolidase
MPYETIVILNLMASVLHTSFLLPGMGRYQELYFLWTQEALARSSLNSPSVCPPPGKLSFYPISFYRYGAYRPLVPTEVFKGDVMAILGPLMATTRSDAVERGGAFFDATKLRIFESITSRRPGEARQSCLPCS